MPYLIGTDEAGYGPNLGPLVISASVWEVPGGVGGEDLYQRLAPAICAKPSGPGIAWADSKVLYQPGKGLRLLERGLWAAFALLGWRPRTCGEVWSLLAPDAAEDRRGVPGYAADEDCAQLAADPGELEQLAAPLHEAFAAAGVRLIALGSRVIFPREFNDEVDRRGSKGAALSHWTLAWVARAVQSLGDGPVSVLCDKHGGRDRYLSLLMDHFPDGLIEVRQEGRQRSVYRFGPAERPLEICFQAKAEAHLPAALASMASKYLRELAMRAFNRFWCGRVAGLEPTAGYPADARRFKTGIAAVQAELGIEDRTIWRAK